MCNIRRHFVANTPIFITAVCFQRQPILKSDKAKELLLSVMREVKQTIPYRMLGYVMLDDHFHWIILPAKAGDFPRIMQSVKLRFTRRFKSKTENFSQAWQPRFWDHIIRNADDLARHLDYVHYNPVKHGFVADPTAYRWSSLKSYVARSRYPSGWAVATPPTTTQGMELE